MREVVWGLAMGGDNEERFRLYTDAVGRTTESTKDNRTKKVAGNVFSHLRQHLKAYSPDHQYDSWTVKDPLTAFSETLLLSLITTSYSPFSTHHCALSSSK